MSTFLLTEVDPDSFDVEFDNVFIVTADSVNIDTSIYAPSVFHSEASDVEIDTPGWEALTGFTGQHGYRGACMHASEQFAGPVARNVLATPGTYVLVVVNVYGDGDEDEEPAGWAILKRTT